MCDGFLCHGFTTERYLREVTIPALARGARVVRGPRREIISRCYNLLLHAMLGTRFSDAQCGFKAIRRDQARALLPLTRDNGWFFDTELLGWLADPDGVPYHLVTGAAGAIAVPPETASAGMASPDSPELVRYGARKMLSRRA